jgi:alpha-L-rhamnosidase
MPECLARAPSILFKGKQLLLLRHFFCVVVALQTTAAYSQQAPSKPLMVTPVSPVRVEHRDDGIFFIDFGHDAFAQLKLRLDGFADQQITVRMGEKAMDADHLDRKPGGSIRFLKTTIVDGVAKLTRADARRMPADIGPVMPFRYVELDGLPAGISTQQLSHAVTQMVVNFPFNDNVGSFSCSDDRLNAVWDLCRYSIKATSYAGIFVDGDRERKPYEADAYINGLGWYCCTDDLTLPLFSDRYLIDHPTWPTEWSMFSVLCAWNDYLYTGDLESLRTAYPDLKAKSLRALEGEDGLISTQNAPESVSGSLHLGNEKLKDIVDWPPGERDGYDMRPVNTVVNAFHCRSLALLSTMASALGDSVDASDCQRAADRSRSSFNQKCFDPETGLYIDGEGSGHSSLHANMFALALGLVPANRRAKIVAYIESRGMACSVYGAQFLMDGLFDNGAGNNAIALMLAPGDRSWRHMVQDTGTSITLEAWDAKFKPNLDWNHAWGAAPANLIPRKVLGVEPAVPGFSKAIIWPRCVGKASSITWARGRVPTAKGPISVNWKASAEGLHLTVELPAGTTARICLPVDWGTHVTADEKSVAGDDDNGIIAINTGPGLHAIVIGR